MRNLHVICYDVQDDRRRTHISHLLEGYGTRVQESFFEIYMNAKQATRLRCQLMEMIDPLTDCIRLHSLCHKDAVDRQILGKDCQAIDFAYIIE